MKTKRQHQTISSFEYKWRHFDGGAHHLNDPEFVSMLPSLISNLTGLPQDWFKEKVVLDVGCGNGRISYGFSELLGAHTDAFDVAQSAVERTRSACPHAKVFKADVFDLPDLPQYDLVWSFGVLHHTGDTKRAFASVANLVKEGGYLFVMIYGNYGGSYRKWNQRFQRWHVPFSVQRWLLSKKYSSEQLIGWFDATSPAINDYYDFETIKKWYEESGFVDIVRTTQEAANPHHNVVGRKAAPR